MASQDFTIEDIQFAVDMYKKQEVIQALMVRNRAHSIEKDHRERMQKSAELEKLKSSALHLARRAGAKGLRSNHFDSFSRSRLLTVIHESRALLQANDQWLRSGVLQPPQNP